MVLIFMLPQPKKKGIRTEGGRKTRQVQGGEGISGADAHKPGGLLYVCSCSLALSHSPLNSRAEDSPSSYVLEGGFDPGQKYWNERRADGQGVLEHVQRRV